MMNYRNNEINYTDLLGNISDMKEETAVVQGGFYKPHTDKPPNSELLQGLRFSF